MHKKSIYPLLLIGVTCVGVLFASNTKVHADPTWWTQSKNEARELAKKLNKGMVLYFESDKAAACKQMDEETWPKISPALADKGYIWLRLNPEQDAGFFEHFAIFQTPQIVVLDSSGAEHGRLKGFVESNILLDLLNQQMQKLKSGDTEKYVLLPSGQLVKEGEYKSRIQAREGLLQDGAFFAETFDTVGSFEELNPAQFQAPQKAGTRLEPHDGKDNTQGLLLAGRRGGTITFALTPDSIAVMVWIDLCINAQGKMLAQVAEIPEGYLLVTLDAKAVDFLPDPIDAISLVITGVNEKPDSPNAIVKSRQLKEGDHQWTPYPIRSPLMNFKTQKAWLVLKTNSGLADLYIDNIRVEIQPPDGVAGAELGGGELDPSVFFGDKRGEDHRIIRFFERDNEATRDGIAEMFEISPEEKKMIEEGHGHLISDLDINKDGQITSDELHKFKW